MFITLDYCVEGRKILRQKIRHLNLSNTLEESTENPNIPFCVKLSGVITLIIESYITDFWCRKNTKK